MRGIDELTEMEKQTEKETNNTDVATMLKTIYDYIVGANDVEEKEEVLEEETEEETEEIKENEGE